MSKSSHEKITIPYFSYGVPPEYIRHGRKGDAGYDVYNKYEYPVVVKPNQTIFLDLGFGVKLPIGKAIFISPRGGHYLKGLRVSHAPVDSNYTGEIKALLSNDSDVDLVLQPFERFGQFVILDVTDNVIWKVSDVSNYNTNRGANWGNSSGVSFDDLPSE